MGEVEQSRLHIIPSLNAMNTPRNFIIVD